MKVSFQVLLSDIRDLPVTLKEFVSIPTFSYNTRNVPFEVGFRAYFIVQRKHRDKLISMILPLFFLGWLSAGSVLIPSESGERVSFIVALELSMIFIQQAVDSYIVPAGQDRNFPFIRTVIIGKALFLKYLLPTPV